MCVPRSVHNAEPKRDNLQALLPVLYDYGVYAESCDGGEGGKLDPTYPCLKMRSKLALVFRSLAPARVKCWSLWSNNGVMLVPTQLRAHPQPVPRSHRRSPHWSKPPAYTLYFYSCCS